MDMSKITKVTLEDKAGKVKVFEGVLSFVAVLQVMLTDKPAYYILRSHDTANTLGVLAVARERILTELRTEIAMSIAATQMVGEFPDASNIQ